ncbi:MAG: hypothetical protein KAJ81_00935, partial [Candidatus Latescibacteria bacterium]|nr:hypothetical protein [Candidatus Latescibacterota bacterium]
ESRGTCGFRRGLNEFRILDLRLSSRLPGEPIRRPVAMHPPEDGTTFGPSGSYADGRIPMTDTHGLERGGKGFAVRWIRFEAPPQISIRTCSEGSGYAERDIRHFHWAVKFMLGQ